MIYIKNNLTLLQSDGFDDPIKLLITSGSAASRNWSTTFTKFSWALPQISGVL